MKFSVGDSVLLKRTGEEGVVTACLGPGMFEVEADGVVFPVHADDMDHPYLKWFTDKKKETRKQVPEEQLPVEKPAFRQARLARGVYLSVLPVYSMRDMEDVVDVLKIFLVNELPFPVRYRYEMRISGSIHFFHDGNLPPFTHVYLHHIPYELMNDQPRFHWELSDAGENRGTGVETGILRIRPAQLFAKIAELQIRNEPMFSYLLTEGFSPPAAPVIPAPVTRGNQGPLRPVRMDSLRDLPRYEVDLHLEEVLPDARNLSPSEILDAQLSHLRHYLRLAVAHRFDRIIVIHGLGKGVLRDAVHGVLRETAEVERFTNEWMGKYGFGATAVYFSY